VDNDADDDDDDKVYIYVALFQAGKHVYYAEVVLYVWLT